MGEIKLYNAPNKTVENVGVFRTSLDNEPVAYSAIFGFYPTHHCSFSIITEDRNDRMKKIAELHDELVKNGFIDFSVNYSNTNLDDDDDESGIITSEICMNNCMVFNDDCLISIGNDLWGVDVLSHKSLDVIKSVIDKYLKKYTGTNDKVKCNIIAHSNYFYLEEFEIKVNGDLDYDLYNEGFEDTNKEIVRSIKEDNNGLYILHGEAGTGKTTYIRYLIKQLMKSKKFVYIPSNLVNELTNPQFMSFIMDNKNCVFVIEDCENLVVTKNNIRSSTVADMLNMTDGILADALKIKIICTFNTAEKNIDEALLRPGRCRMKYDFTKLKKDRAIKVAKKLGLQEPDKDISLAELFSGENKYVEEKKKIGF